MSKKSHRKKYKPYKFQNELCSNDMTFQDCELTILRHAVDESDIQKKKQIINNEDIKHILLIVEQFIVKKKLVCYGGTAINNILPKDAQFYDRELEIPDYDFFSTNALNDAKELADIYYAAGYVDVEAKSGVHQGTFKVFVNFIPIADITMMNPTIFKKIQQESIVIEGIHYAPPNYLRMAIYLELSRPLGDVSRWEKIIKRLNVLNEYYPFNVEKCETVDFQRAMESHSDESEKLYLITRDALVDEKVVFFGGYATSLYSKYIPEKYQSFIQRIPDFDVLSLDIDHCSLQIKKVLDKNGFTKVRRIHHAAIGELIPEHIEIRVDKETIAFIYRPIACHSYNVIHIENRLIQVATIDTILTFYLSFMYAGMKYYNKERLLCMAKFLFDVEQKNRLAQKGLLKRFTIDCYGTQPTLEDIRSEKAEKYKELKMKRGTEEYEMWFLKYTPDKYTPDKYTPNKEVNSSKELKKKTTKGTTKGTTKKTKKRIHNLFAKPQLKHDFLV